jgi:hypothetical protein
MALSVPLQPIPNQTLQVQLNGQACTLDVVQYTFGLFMSVTVGNTLIIASVLCENLNRIVRSSYLGFSGDLLFLDMQGESDPAYTGFGGQSARYQLLYMTEEELAALGSE